MAETLCVYILLDHSASMSGTALESLRQGVQVLLSAFESYSGRLIKAAVLAYESMPTVVTPLQAIHSELFHADVNLILATLEPVGASNLGKALRRLAVELPQGASAALYLFSDGGFTDDWQEALAELRPRLKRFYAVACGIAPDRATLSAADQVLSVGSLTTDSLLATLRVAK
ncbi:MAG: VWA domain-containing protein [Anaerolineae bacterium]|nr:VWA domain-containing protein [Anaerolineae bacterium]MDW8299553.1 VWA domain-containing protein [Anaerolineae bacterium]